MASMLASAEAIASPAVTASRRVALGSALLAVGCVLGLIEASLPAVPFAPWLRFGLANIAVVIALETSGVRLAAAVSLGRLVIVGLATGSLASPTFALSVIAALAAIGVMWALAGRVRGLTAVGWSAAGSAAHVFAQFVAAAVLLGSGSLLVLAPPSVVLALVLGALVGYLARIAVSRLQLG